MKVGTIILAAGGSSRLGRAKQLLPVEGETLLRHSARAVVSSKASSVVVVLGAEASVCMAELAGLPVRIVIHSSWRDGMASSVVAGLKALSSFESGLDAVILSVCDQPYLSTEVIDRLIHAHNVSGKGVIASCYGDVKGVPALFASRHFDALHRLVGDQGARSLFATFPDDLACIDFPEGGTDIDTPADYGRLPDAEITVVPARRSAGAARSAVQPWAPGAIQRSA